MPRRWTNADGMLGGSFQKLERQLHNEWDAWKRQRAETESRRATEAAIKAFERKYIA